ncbi:hypothetical protein WEI85_00220 [Actinomycetes bacterium KLBMP 9797]
MVAVVGAYGEGRDHGHLRARAAEAGYRADGASVARLDRVVIELLLREHLTSSAIREDLVPRLLVRRVVVSWWRPSAPVAAPDLAWVSAADPAVLCAVAVPCVVRTWVMAALTGKELP